MSVPTTVRTISPKQLWEMINANKASTLIDVRTRLEYATVHATPATSMPLDELKPDAVRGSQPVFLICKSGKRAAQACEKLSAAGVTDVFSVEGGTDAWTDAGLPVLRRNVMSIERQVRIGAGVIVLTGAILSWFVHPAFVGISAFVGAGLVFAGVTDWCGMGLLIAKMPWNRHCDGATCAK